MEMLRAAVFAKTSPSQGGQWSDVGEIEMVWQAKNLSKTKRNYLIRQKIIEVK